MATKKQFTQSADQSAARTTASRENVGGANIHEHVSEDVGGGERNVLTNADHQDAGFRNRKDAEERARFLSNVAADAVVELTKQVNQIGVGVLANAASVANLVANNAALAANLTNNGAANSQNRTDGQRERHADLAMDNQWTSQAGVDDDTGLPKQD